jgi:hypothetical protein
MNESGECGVGELCFCGAQVFGGCSLLVSGERNATRLGVGPANMGIDFGWDATRTDGSGGSIPKTRLQRVEDMRDPFTATQPGGRG